MDLEEHRYRLLRGQRGVRDSEANLGILNSVNVGFFFFSLKYFPNILDANKNGNLPLGLVV